MLTYTFGISYKGTVNERPYMIISNYPETLWSDEIFHLDRESVLAIVKELEQVKAGELDKCIFGFDITLVWVYQKGKGYYGEKYPDSEVTITYSEDKYLITDLKIEDILKMMTDWRDYIDKWEKETGKIFKP